MDCNELNTRIDDFKRITQKQSVTPVLLGDLLRNISDTITDTVEPLLLKGVVNAFDGACFDFIDIQAQVDKTGLYLHVDDALSICGVYLATAGSSSSPTRWLKFPIDAEEGVDAFLDNDQRVEYKGGDWILRPNSLFYADKITLSHGSAQATEEDYGMFFVTDKSGRLQETALNEMPGVTQSIWNLKKSTEGILNLGTVVNTTAAYDAAAAPSVVSNPRIRMITWRTSDSMADGGRGDGGTIFQERYGNWYVVQWMMFEGSNKRPKARLITTGGNYSCGNWLPLLLPVDVAYEQDASSGKLSFWSIDGTVMKAVRIPAVPEAQAGEDGNRRQYIWSENNADSTMAVLSAPYTYLVQGSGKLKLVKGLWNPTGTDIHYTRDVVPTATASADGAMSKEVFNRLGAGATIYETTPGATAVTVSYPNWANGGNRTFTLNCATSARAGVMSAADKIKLNNLPDAVAGKSWSTHDFSNEWLTRLSNTGLYGRTSGTKFAVNGIFSLKTSSTPAEVKAALTSGDGRALTEADLNYCADNGVMLFDEATNGYVMVNRAHGGTAYNLIELSIRRIGADAAQGYELPRLRYITITSTLATGADPANPQPEDYIFKVNRDGKEVRLATETDIAALQNRITALEGK